MATLGGLAIRQRGKLNITTSCKKCEDEKTIDNLAENLIVRWDSGDGCGTD